MTCPSFPLLLCMAAIASLLPSSRAVGECSLCGDDKTVHDDHQQMLLFVSERETYTTCTDLAVALLETADDSSHCSEIQTQFADSCCLDHETTSIHRRASWNTASSSSWTTSSSWNTPPSTPVSSATTSWGGWGQSPAKPTTTTYTPWNTGSTSTFPTTTQSVLSSFNSNVVKPTVGWWTNRNPVPAPITPLYVLPAPVPAPRPQYTPSNVVLSDHPAWGQNNGPAVSKAPGLNYVNDGFCGICTDPSNGSLGIVVDGFGVAGFTYRGPCHSLNAAFRRDNIRTNHQMCNLTRARFLQDCGCGGFNNNAQQFFGAAPQSNTGSWCIKGHTC